MKKLEGGCLCESVRYHISATPFAAEYCHCRMCKKFSGAPVASWMDFNIEQVNWKKRKPVEYQSSENILRGFCPTCGSSLSFRDTEHPEYITLAIASLDEPNLVKPTYHIYTASQLKWLNIDDECKRFTAGPEKSPN